jgi:hypothetical protein
MNRLQSAGCIDGGKALFDSQNNILPQHKKEMSFGKDTAYVSDDVVNKINAIVEQRRAEGAK